MPEGDAERPQVTQPPREPPVNSVLQNPPDDFRMTSFLLFLQNISINICFR